MKKFMFSIVCLVLASTTVHAAHPTYNAIGYENGFSMRFLGESGFGFQGIVGLGFLVPDDTDTNNNDFDLSLSANVFRCMWESEHANFNLFTGVDFLMDGDTLKDSDSTYDVAVKFGAEPELFLSPRLSVSTKMGIKLYIAGDRRNTTGKTTSDTGWMKFGTFGDMFGGAALNWYF